MSCGREGTSVRRSAIRAAAAVSMILVGMGAACRRGDNGDVSRFTENGIEIVSNGTEPAHIMDRPSVLSLREEFRIDAEDERFAGTERLNIRNFAVDSKGDIIVLTDRTSGDLMFRFGPAGRFEGSFGRGGQGPGEIAAADHLSLATGAADEVMLLDLSGRLHVFDRTGGRLIEVDAGRDLIYAASLDNELWLVCRVRQDLEGDYVRRDVLGLAMEELQPVKVLDVKLVPNVFAGRLMKGIPYTLSWSTGAGRIYTGFQDRGYDIFVYDLDGRPIRKIRKDSPPVPYHRDFRRFMEQASGGERVLQSRIYFPVFMPAYHGFFADDEGRLFVMTYEKGCVRGEWVYDIFDVDGRLIAQEALPVHHDWWAVYGRSKNGRLYALREKSNGFREIVVYRMSWAMRAD